MTTRMSRLVFGKSAQARVPLGLGAPKPDGEEGKRDRLEVTGTRHEGESRKSRCDGGDD